MKKISAFIAVLALATLTGCGVNNESAKRVLEAQGMSSVKVGSYTLFGCGKDDQFRSRFSAIGANGRPVTGSVCSGWLKGITVRFD